jgi:peptidoglycan/xylan/chitin deacetylase (PgdA/CDA1 family)
LTLHHVRPARAGAFQPNRSLEISPEFLDTLITEFRRQGLEFISLDEMHRRLTEGRFLDRFVCITFDDGYRDNAEYAYPILRYHQVPFAIFVASDFADWRGHLWWDTLEDVVSAGDRLAIMFEGGRGLSSVGPPQKKMRAVRAIHQIISDLPPGGGGADVRKTRCKDGHRRGRELCGSVHELERALAARRRSARHDRRAHGKPPPSAEAGVGRRLARNGSRGRPH